MCVRACALAKVCFDCFGSLFCNGLCAPISEKQHIREYIIVIIINPRKYVALLTSPDISGKVGTIIHVQH